MTERAMQYGKVLFELKVAQAVMEATDLLLRENKALMDALDNPAIKADEKHRVIDKLFDKSITGFLKVVTDNHIISEITDIFEACEECAIEEKNWVKASFYYVSKPSEEQLNAVKERICKEYNKDGVSLELIEQPSLLGGFVLKVKDFETDRSIKGRLEQLTKNLVRR